MGFGIDDLSEAQVSDSTTIMGKPRAARRRGDRGGVVGVRVGTVALAAGER